MNAPDALETSPRTERRWGAVGECVREAGVRVVVTHVSPGDKFQESSQGQDMALLGRPHSQKVFQNVVDACGARQRHFTPLFHHIRFCRVNNIT